MVGIYDKKSNASSLCCCEFASLLLRGSAAFGHRYWNTPVPPGSWSRRPINQRTRRARWQAAIQVRGRLEYKMLPLTDFPEATARRAHASMLRAVAHVAQEAGKPPLGTRLRP